MRNKGLIGLLVLLIFVVCIGAGYFYIQQNPQFKTQLEEDLNQVVKEATSDTTKLVSPLDLAEDQQKRESVKAVSNAIFDYVAGNKGLLPKDFPTEETCIGLDENCYDLGQVLVPTFLDEMPTGLTTFKNKEGRVVVRVKGSNGDEYEIVR